MSNRVQFQRHPDRLEEAGAFRPIVLNLADTDLSATSGGRSVTIDGYSIVFKREGSSPAARLTIDMGGPVEEFSPGDRITARDGARFHAFTVRNSGRGVAAGRARLQVVTNPHADYREADSPSPVAPTFTAVDLLGSIVGGTKTFVTVAEDTDPVDGALPTGAFSINGFRKIRLIIDTQTGGVNATSFTLVPWFAPPNSGRIWCENGYEKVNILDSDTSGRRYRVILWDVSGEGEMYFSIRSLLEAARTGLGFIVQGIA